MIGVKGKMPEPRSRRAKALRKRQIEITEAKRARAKAIRQRNEREQAKKLARATALSRRMKRHRDKTLKPYKDLALACIAGVGLDRATMNDDPDRYEAQMAEAWSALLNNDKYKGAIDIMVQLGVEPIKEKYVPDVLVWSIGSVSNQFSSGVGAHNKLQLKKLRSSSTANIGLRRKLGLYNGKYKHNIGRDVGTIEPVGSR